MNVDIVSRNLREISRLLDEIADEIKVQTAEPVRRLPEGEKKPLPRMRTLPQAVKEMREADPGTHLNITALRRWVKAGLIPTVQSGKNPLVNMDTLERFMEGGGPNGKY